MRQSRSMSAVEAVTNVLIGYVVAVATNWLVLPLFGFAVGVGDSAAIGLVFTRRRHSRLRIAALVDAFSVRSRARGDPGAVA